MRDDLADLFDLLVVSCPGFGAGWTDEQAEAWGRLLEPLPQADLRRAVAAWVESNRFAPSYAELRAATLAQGRRRASAAAERVRRTEVEQLETLATKRATEALRRTGRDPAQLSDKVPKVTVRKLSGLVNVERASAGLRELEE
jgi:hypothetical protein